MLKNARPKYEIKIHQNVRFAYSSVCKIFDNADRITESAKSRTEVFVQQNYHSPIGMNYTKNYRCESHTFLLHLKEINSTEMYIYCTVM